MTTLNVLALGVIQGLTEFLPVSSSGHLLAARLLFGISDVNGFAVDAFLHLGTLAAVLIYFRRLWWRLMRALLKSADNASRDDRNLLAKLAVATVPAAIAGYFFQSDVSLFFRSREALAGSLLFTALVLWWFDARARASDESGERADFKDAGIIGLAQVIALLPGVSRSGVTIAAGRGRGLSRRQATVFSFLMSAPIIAGAGLNSLSQLLASPVLPWAQLALGFAAAAVSGLAAIAGLLKFIERISFLPFVVYLIGLAALVLRYG